MVFPQSVPGDVSVFSWTLNLVHLDLHDTRVNGRLKARLPLKDADFHMPGLEVGERGFVWQRKLEYSPEYNGYIVVVCCCTLFFFLVCSCNK